MRVLLACEFSGAVRREFHKRGHFAVSCDLLPSEEPWRGFNPWHYEGDVREIIERRVRPFYSRLNEVEWDMMIAFPPCTHLAVSGARWFHLKRREQAEALDFVRTLMAAPISRIAIENPVSIISSRIRKPDQIIQPHQFEHPEFKATCLWFKNLPKLVSTNPLQVPKKGTTEWTRWNRVHRASPGPDRWKERSRTYSGIAQAMAEQWGALPPIVS